MSDSSSAPFAVRSGAAARRHIEVDDGTVSGRSLNDAAVRLWQIDMALQHLTRNAGMLGLGANATQTSLREERENIVERLRALGNALTE